jgi:signal peptidase I
MDEERENWKEREAVGGSAGFSPAPEEHPPEADRTPPPAFRAKSRLREWAESLAFTIVFVLVFTRFVAQATQVPTESMKPAIMVGDHFFLDKLAFPANYPETVRAWLPEREIQRGDVVAFRAPDQGEIPFVKRVIGLPGETIEVRDKIVWINGVRLVEPYKIHVDEELYTADPWTPEQLRIRDNFGPVEVPEGAYFAMGDNRDNSNDSRYWGFVSEEDMIGKPMFVYWSYQNDTPHVPGQRTLADRLEVYASVAIHFFSRTRWFRLGTMIE